MDANDAARGIGRFFADPDFRGDKANELFSLLPVHAPVVPIGDQWVVSGHQLVKRLSASTSLVMGQAEFPNQARLDNAGFVEFFSTNLFFRPPDEHARLKGLLTAHFVPRTMEALREPTRRIADSLFAAATSNPGPFDVVSEVAAKLPPLVAAVLIGVAEQDREWLAVQAAGLLSELCRSFPSTGGDDNEPIGSHRFAELRSYFDDLLLRDRAGDGSLGRRLAAAVRSGAVELSDATDLLMLLLMAGVDTVITGIANAVSVLLEHPGDLARIGAGMLDPSAAFGEALRLFTPVPFARRTVAATRTVDGIDYRAGQDILLCLAAGNRDPEQFVGPSSWQPGRGGGGALSFGHGAYHCVGAALGMIEGSAVLGSLAALGPVRRADDATRWNRNLGFHSPEEIKVSII